MPTPDFAGAKPSLRAAVDVVRRQGAKRWEVRRATSLARLWHDLLAPVSGWFTARVAAARALDEHTRAELAQAASKGGHLRIDDRIASQLTAVVHEGLRPCPLAAMPIRIGAEYGARPAGGRGPARVLNRRLSYP